MARPTLALIENHRAQIAFYKWEFLRKNEDYQRDYNRLMKRHAKILGQTHYPRPECAARLSDAVRKNLGYLHFKWGIGFMQNPGRWVPRDAMEKNPRRRVTNPFWETHGCSILSDVAILNWDTVQFKNLAIDFRRSWEWVPIAINLEVRPNTLLRQLEASLKRIRRNRFVKAKTPLLETGERVDSNQKHWKNLVRKGFQLPKRRVKPIRLEASTFDNYLMAWKLRQKGHSFRRIAASLNASVPRTIPIKDALATDKDLRIWESNRILRKTNLRKARRAVINAQKLIAGGYRHIS